VSQFYHSLQVINHRHPVSVLRSPGHMRNLNEMKLCSLICKCNIIVVTNHRMWFFPSHASSRQWYHSYRHLSLRVAPVLATICILDIHRYRGIVLLFVSLTFMPMMAIIASSRLLCCLAPFVIRLAVAPTRHRHLLRHLLSSSHCCASFRSSSAFQVVRSLAATTRFRYAVA
jgi:hypothetical protein